MPSCSIQWCGKRTSTSNYLKDGITFHRFPQDVNMKIKWLEVTKRDDFIPTKTSVMCSRHFQPDCFRYSKKNRSRRLYEWAVPTLFLPTLVSHPASESEQESLTKKTQSEAATEVDSNAVLLNKKKRQNLQSMTSVKKERSEINSTQRFEYVKKNCIDLVKVHGRPLELFDDAAFQNILTLLLSVEEVASLTSTFIEEYIEERESTDDENSVLDTITLKKECTCSNVTEDWTGINHDSDCPMLAEHYYNHFEDEVFQIGPLSVYGGDSDNEQAASDTQHSSETPTVGNITIVTQESDPQTAILKNKHCEKQSTNSQSSNFVKLKNSKIIPLDSFKDFDRFGLYISVLMKALPLDKRIKYQRMFINILLNEQAAAG